MAAHPARPWLKEALRRQAWPGWGGNILPRAAAPAARSDGLPPRGLARRLRWEWRDQAPGRRHPHGDPAWTRPATSSSPASARSSARRRCWRTTSPMPTRRASRRSARSSRVSCNRRRAPGRRNPAARTSPTASTAPPGGRPPPGRFPPPATRWTSRCAARAISRSRMPQARSASPAPAASPWRPDGRLVDAEGNAVLDTRSAPITIGPGDSRIEIQGDGTIRREWRHRPAARGALRGAAAAARGGRPAVRRGRAAAADGPARRGAGRGRGQQCQPRHGDGPHDRGGPRIPERGEFADREGERLQTAVDRILRKRS